MKADKLLGYKGLGTAEKPILIENAQGLMGLAGIGAKGYYFLQTADIDCNAITTWPSINLQGHYNGGGYFIQNRNNYALFQSIQTQSSIKNLGLRNLYLAVNVTGSHIEACVTNQSLIIGGAMNSTITACQASNNLIGGNANNCTINACQSNWCLILGTATNSIISGCLVTMNVSIKVDYQGGIANTLKNSNVGWCLVIGKVNLDSSSYDFSGITENCDASTIHQCAIGKVKLNTSRFHRITRNIQNNSILNNNISIDSNGQYNDLQNGKSISATLFNQRYFEHTLGWDFNNVWQWDAQKNHPVLRWVGVNTKTTAPAADMVDLLSQQIQANIWL